MHTFVQQVFAALTWLTNSPAGAPNGKILLQFCEMVSTGFLFAALSPEKESGCDGQRSALQQSWEEISQAFLPNSHSCVLTGVIQHATVIECGSVPPKLVVFAFVPDLLQAA